MPQIDRRQLISLRREEANLCIHYGLYHAATLTACSAIEMLLKALFDELMVKLRSDDPHLANILQNYTDEMNANGQPVDEWGLGRWIGLYDSYNIFAELRSRFDYRFVEFRVATLSKANQEWNRCKHSSDEASPVTAREVCKFLNTYLDETKHQPNYESTQMHTVGEFSEQWLVQWNTEIRRWHVHNRTASAAMILQRLPHLLALIVGLISDKSTPLHFKNHLMLAANYVFSSVDLMPEDSLDVRGLVDDGAVLVLTLFWLLHHKDLDAELLRRHWSQNQEDIVSEIDRLEQYIRVNNEKLFTQTHLQFGRNLIWATIRRVATEGPEALWQNYWQEAY